MKRLFALLLALLLLGAAAGYAETAGTSPDSPDALNSLDSQNPLKSPSSFDERCLDQYGQPTMYALTELTGPELVQLLEEQGYAWVEKDNTLRWFRREITLPDTTIPQFVTLQALDGYLTGIWSREEYDSAKGKGAVAAGQISYIMAGYRDPKNPDWGVLLGDVVQAFVNIEIEDRIDAKEFGAVFLKVKDASGKKYIISLTQDGGGRTGIQIDTDQSLATTKPPSSVEKQWKDTKKYFK